MTERRYIILMSVGMCLWAVLIYMILAHAPRVNNPTDCQKLAQPEQAKCKARRKL